MVLKNIYLLSIEKKALASESVFKLKFFILSKQVDAHILRFVDTLLLGE
jgi:hypothetical protein